MNLHPRSKVAIAAAILVTGLLVTGCNQPAASAPAQTTNPSIPVEKLFDHEGCTVYRFRDASRNVYYAKCADGGHTHWRQSCGKNCSRPMAMSAVNGDAA